MKLALVTPNEISYLGFRVAQVEADTDSFEVAQPLFWTACPDEAVADLWFYDPDDQAVKVIPIPDVSGVQTV